MDQRTSETNSSQKVGRRTKRVSGTEQAFISVEVVLEPIEVQVPLVAVPVEVRDVPVAVAILPDRSYELSSMPLPLEYP